jgi:hypothetical protein
MGMLERIGGLLDVEVTRAESEGVSGDSAAAIASLTVAYRDALGARVEEKVVEWREHAPAAEVTELDGGGREFRLGVVTGEGKEQRTVEKVVRASGRDAALSLARAAWPAALDVVVVDEGNDGGGS